MFRFNANSGNNLFLDDIHISDSDQPVPLTVGLDDNGIKDFSLFPNPGKGLFTLKFYLKKSSPLQAEIVDLLGKRYELNFDQEMTNGWNTVLINTDDYDLKHGMYFIKLRSGEQIISRSLIIE